MPTFFVATKLRVYDKVYDSQKQLSMNPCGEHEGACSSDAITVIRCTFWDLNLTVLPVSKRNRERTQRL